MNLILKIVLVALVLLAISSGVTKVMLMPQEIAIFGKYGFTNALLIAFGVAQVLGGLLLIVPKSRAIGSGIVALTFLISAIVLALEGNYLLTIVTLICIGLLGLVFKRSLKR